MPTTETTTKRGFAAPCLKCGEQNSVHVFLYEVTTFLCDSCNEEWTLDEAREIVSGWSKVLAWVESAPVVTE